MTRTRPTPFGDPDISSERYFNDRLCKRYAHWYVRIGSTTAWETNSGLTVTGVGTASNVAENTRYWLRRTGAGTDGAESSQKSSAVVTRMGRLPRFWFRFRTGSDITYSAYWVGLYTTTAPTKSATYTTRHAMIRYIAGTDSGWLLDNANGTNQWTDSTVLYAAANSQELVAEIDCSISGQVTATLYDWSGNILSSRVGSTYIPAAADDLYWFCGMFAIGAYARVCDWAGTEFTCTG